MKYQFATLLSAIVVVLGDDSELAAENANYTCKYNGKEYKLGEHIETPETPCYRCICNKGFEKPSPSPPSQCAIIDCPWEYYNSKPHCKTEYVAGKCCPEFRCSAPPPNLDAAFLLDKKDDGSTDGYNITANLKSEITIYCIPDKATDDLSGKNIEWKHIKANGTEEAVSNTTETALAFFSPSTWALYFPALRASDDGLYICTIPTTPPQTQTTRITIRTESRPPIVDAICLKPAFSDVENNPCLPNKEAKDLPWYFSSELGTCTQHKENSCKWGKENHFASGYQCWDNCYDACIARSDAGPCNEMTKRYYYLYSTDKCEAFDYGGCGGNNNNFQSLEKCEDGCLNTIYRKISDKKLN